MNQDKRNALKHLFNLFEKHEESEMKLVKFMRSFNRDAIKDFARHKELWAEHDALERAIITHMASWTDKELDLIREQDSTYKSVIKELDI